MKKLLYILPLASIFLLSCGGGGNESAGEGEASTEANSENEMAAVTTDLSEFGWDYTIGLPDKKNVQTSINENDWGGLDIQQGEMFWITVNYGEGDIDLLKFDLEEHEFYTAEISEESADHLVYKLEAKEGGLAPTYHFVYVLRIEGDAIEIQNSKDADFSEEAIQSMLSVAKSMTAKAGA